MATAPAGKGRERTYRNEGRHRLSGISVLFVGCRESGPQVKDEKQAKVEEAVRG